MCDAAVGRAVFRSRPPRPPICLLPSCARLLRPALVACRVVCSYRATTISQIQGGSEAMKGLARLAVVLSLALTPALVRADVKALQEAAKNEGELTWYVAHYTSEGAEELGSEFTKLYAVKVNVVRTTAQVAYQRLLQDLKNNQAVCDIFSSTDVGHHVRLQAEGKFAKSLPETRA